MRPDDKIEQDNEDLTEAWALSNYGWHEVSRKLPVMGEPDY
jgi:hypothetical protein